MAYFVLLRQQLSLLLAIFLTLSVKTNCNTTQSYHGYGADAQKQGKYLVIGCLGGESYITRKQKMPASVGGKATEPKGDVKK